MFASSAKKTCSHTNGFFLVGLARAFAGASLFSFPTLMTMEMWWLGFTVEPARLALMLALSLPLLVALSYYVGFEDTPTLLNDVVDAFVACAVGFVTSAVVLALFCVIGPGMPTEEIVGKIVIQSVVASIGAMLAQSELGGGGVEKGKAGRRKRHARYTGQLFLMGIGAIFLAMNPAPTEEIQLIAFQMSGPHLVALGVFSLGLMQAFVYHVDFRGQEHRRSRPGFSSFGVFLKFTVPGYALVLLIGLYLLWTFGRIDGLSLVEATKLTVVVGFPASLGAAASRLIL